MTKQLITLVAALALASPISAQDAEEDYPPSPWQIVDQLEAEEWIAIPAEDLVVMDLAPDATGKQRRIVIQLMPAPFGGALTQNIRSLARANWFDGTAVIRVQDNYVVQWGDPNADVEDQVGGAKPLPVGLQPTSEASYTIPAEEIGLPRLLADSRRARALETDEPVVAGDATTGMILANGLTDPYAQMSLAYRGWPLASNYGQDENEGHAQVWPVHCYGMVGVGRDLPPNAGDGSSLYTVIGHAPRHLDRNIAVVGRIVEGIEHLSSLPRGTGDLGFYEDPAEQTMIERVRIASEMPEADRPRFEYLDTEGPGFARYADAIANRQPPFFIVPAGGADICNIRIPVRRTGG